MTESPRQWPSIGDEAELFIDVETTPVRHDQRLPEPVVAAYAYGDGPIGLCSPEEARQRVAGATTVVGHNVAFDLAVLGCIGQDTRCYDTAIRATLLGAAHGDPAAADSSLKRLAKKVGIELGGKGTVQLSFRQGVPLTPEQESYVKEDIRATRAVYRDQPRSLPDEQQQVAYARSIFAMAREGVHVDLPRIKSRVVDLERTIGVQRGELVDAGLIQPRGPKREPWKRSAVDGGRLQDLLESAGAVKRTATGDLAADEDVLLQCSKQHPLLATLVEYNRARKQYAMWSAFDTGEGDVVRAYWKPLVLTGRISCSRPNLTNIPQRGGLRECILPKTGKVLVVADYPALEMRTWAYACLRWLGFSTLVELWRQGKDPHWQTAASILGTSYDGALAHPRGKETRQIAKALNFGLPGGMGQDRLREHLRSHGFDVGPLQAWELRRAWLKAYPEAKLYFEYIKNRAEGDKFRIELPDSRRVRCGFYSEACNYPFQGMGADCAKRAVQLSQRAGLCVLALVHDELLAECDLADAQEVGTALTSAMRQAGEERCPGVPWDNIEYKIYPERWVSK